MPSSALQNVSNCSSCGLQKICFANGLMTSDFQHLDTLVDRKPSLSKGEMLFSAGKALESLYAIRAGSIKVYSFDSDGGEVIHGFYLPGDIVGMEALADENHYFHAIALDVTTVCEIPFERLTEFSQQIPSLNSQIFGLMSQEIVNTRLHSSLLTQKSAEQRLAYFIYGMAQKYKQRGYLHTRFRFNVLHRDVANFLNLTPETVSRILAKFNKDQVVSWKRKEIHIINEEALRIVAGIEKS